MKLVLAVVAGALFANLASRLIAWAREEEEAIEEREERLDLAVAEWRQAESHGLKSGRAIEEEDRDPVVYVQVVTLGGRIVATRAVRRSELN